MVRAPVITCFCLLAFLLGSGSAAAAEQATVTASGTGWAETAPDIARLRFGVTARTATVAEGRDEVARGVARLIALARDTGLADEHIATAALSVRADREYDPETRTQRDKGYVVSREVRLKLTDIGRLGELIEAALGLGVTEASPPVFESSRRDALAAEALAEAARDARMRAAAMAEALDGRLGPPVSIHSGGAPSVPRPMMMRSASAEADDMPGEQTYKAGLVRVTESVVATFELQIP